MTVYYTTKYRPPETPPPPPQGRNIKEDIIVGSYELYITDDYAYIGSLEIQPQYRQKGIATQKLCELANQ